MGTIKQCLWYVMAAAVSKEIAARLYDDIAYCLRQPDLIGNLANQGAAPGALTQPQFADFVKSEAVKWGQVVKASGAKAD